MQELNFQNVKIIFYSDTKLSMQDESNLYYCIDSLSKNTKRYDPDLFKNMVIEIYQNGYTGSPFNGNNAVGYSEAWNNKIIIKYSVFDNIDHLADLLSHEIGHYRAYKTGFNDTNHFMRKELNRIRGIFATSKISIDEMVAEDFYYYFGVDGYSKGIFRTDAQVQHLNPDNIQGLKQFYQIYGIVYNYTKNNFNLSLGQIKNIKFIYLKDYCAVEFEYSLFGWFSFDRYRIDPNGIYKRNNFHGLYDRIRTL